MNNNYIDDCELYVLWNLYNGNLNCLDDKFIKSIKLEPNKALSTGGNYFKISTYTPIEWNNKTMEKIIFKFHSKYNFDIAENGDSLVTYVNENIREQITKDVAEYLVKFRDNKLKYNIKIVTKFINKVSHQQTKNILKFERQRDEMLKAIDKARRKTGNVFEIENPFSIIKMRKGDRNISSKRYLKRNRLFFHTLLCLEITGLIKINKLGFGNNFNLMFDEKGVEYKAEIEILPKFEPWLRGNYINTNVSYNPDLRILRIEEYEFKITGNNQKRILPLLIPDDKLLEAETEYINFSPDFKAITVKNTLNDLKKKLAKKGLTDFFGDVGNNRVQINPKYLK